MLIFPPSVHIIGGASGIGLAAVKLPLEKNATVHVIDLVDPDDEDWQAWPRFHVHKADVRQWIELSDAFAAVDLVDYVFVNAGLGMLDDDLLVDHVDATGRLKEPKFLELDTNIRGVFNTSKIDNNPSQFHWRMIQNTPEQQLFRQSM